MYIIHLCLKSSLKINTVIFGHLIGTWRKRTVDKAEACEYSDTDKESIGNYGSGNAISLTLH
jgi:hypothetical protein